jgi:RHH-type proline utilization regulon transcriptional repressor/proline dehydrogenase/delta 1-pyrroline-5-carboxylate dehydrogenase
VLAVMVANSLEEATTWQNDVDFGLTAGLHSLDEAQCAWWLEYVAAGNLYVNRGTTGAVVRRQPFGGWKRSSVGPTAKAGGAHYVASLCAWRALEDEATAIDEFVAWWHEEGAHALDPSALRVERNVYRFRPYAGALVVRVDESWSATLDAYVATVAAMTGVSVTLSSATPVATRLTLRVESVGALVARSTDVAKVRWLSAERAPALELIKRGCVLDRRPIAQRGTVEGPRWLVEQSVAVANHRYGNVGAGPRPAVPGLGEARPPSA